MYLIYVVYPLQAHVYLPCVTVWSSVQCVLSFWKMLFINAGHSMMHCVDVSHWHTLMRPACSRACRIALGRRSSASFANFRVSGIMSMSPIRTESLRYHLFSYSCVFFCGCRVDHRVCASVDECNINWNNPFPDGKVAQVSIPQFVVQMMNLDCIADLRKEVKRERRIDKLSYNMPRVLHLIPIPIYNRNVLVCC